MCALRARASLGRFVVKRTAFPCHLSGPARRRLVGVLHALQTLMHADLAVCVPRLSQVRNAMVRAAPRKADDRHLLRQCPQRAHRHHRCPAGLTPKAHHVSPRAAPPSPHPHASAAGKLQQWQAGKVPARPAQHVPGRTAHILPPCAHRAARALRLWPGCFPPPAVAARCAMREAFAGVCVWSDFSLHEGTRARRAADAAPHLRSPLTRSPLAQFHGQHVYDRVSVHRPTRVPLEGA